MFTRILVPLDGSPLSLQALPVAADLARKYGASLRLVYVVPDVPPVSGLAGGMAYAYDPAADYAARREEGERVLREALADPVMDGLPVDSDCLPAEGRPVAQVLVQETRSSGADLIVMSTHGRGGLARLLLGSVAEGVLHHAGVPVLLVRQPRVSAPSGERRAGVGA